MLVVIAIAALFPTIVKLAAGSALGALTPPAEQRASGDDAEAGGARHHVA
jgi:hypothetical protein